ncbi:MAG: PsbP-related protein [Bacillota bacterium]
MKRIIMKKFVLILFVLSFTILLAACGKDTSIVDGSTVWDTYTNSSFGIKHPEGWNMYPVESEESGVLLYSFSEYEESVPTLIITQVKDVLDGATETEKAQLIFDSRENLIESYDDSGYSYTVLETGSSEIDGQLSYMVDFRIQDSSDSARTIAYTTYYKNDVYIITFIDEDSNYENSVEICGEMIDSIEFLN